MRTNRKDFTFKLKKLILDYRDKTPGITQRSLAENFRLAWEQLTRF